MAVTTTAVTTTHVAAGAAPDAVARRPTFADRLFATRRYSVALTEPLTAEDMTVQPMDDASPTKWHLAHVTWFFETFVLLPYFPGYRVFDRSFNYCFNSYYESQGERQPRPFRGLLTRPSSERVLDYRAHVDAGLAELFGGGGGTSDLAAAAEIERVVEIGINHEQQHQELLLTDILALFAANPLRPAYRAVPASSARSAASTLTHPTGWIDFPGGIVEVGHTGAGFSWDNERPRHDALLHPFRLADRLVINGDWLEFIADGGYDTASLWLADGWSTVCRQGWNAPLYWERRDDAWLVMSLEGLQPVDRAAPVRHVSFFEADAYARWAGKRLPTEFEWEHAADVLASDDVDDTRCRDLFGHVWQWTQSAYLPYPGYRPPAGALGEYNGKFMVSQQVLRGSSSVTPPGHSRSTYRNFFYPHQRWQFVGLRLASET